MRERSVVSSFIVRRRPPTTVAIDKDKHRISQYTGELGYEILLLKRSDKVHTHQGKWAAVSGSLEPEDPDLHFRAATEIQEETTLIAEKDIRLLRQGEKLVIQDEGSDVRWSVHPFLWELIIKDEEEDCEGGEIEIDFEHVGYSWFPVADVLEDIDGTVGGETVPRLLETFKRVWANGL